MNLSSTEREIFNDKKFTANVENDSCSNKLFLRLACKEINFTKVDFKYTIFDNCYLRGCKFDSCDFTGCKFIGCNLHGSHFTGCKFDYCNFERTMIESEILDNQAPAYENLKRQFARTLRLNYQSIGDSDSVNKAILFELGAEGEHLYKAWHSNEGYYRNKYGGFLRFKYFLKWFTFKLLDFIWGNGESIYKLIRSIIIVFLILTIVDVFVSGDPLNDCTGYLSPTLPVIV